MWAIIPVDAQVLFGDVAVDAHVGEIGIAGPQPSASNAVALNAELSNACDIIYHVERDARFQKLVFVQTYT